MASTLLDSPPADRFAPLLRRTIGDDVLDTLRKAIIAGTFAPGDHIAEASLARELAVSRAPVREAMMQLEREGLLAFDKRGAARVKVFTDQDFEEIFSLRLNLETMAARLACRRFSPADEPRFLANIERTRSASRLLELTLVDVEFHDLMVQTARHSRLSICWSTLRHQLEYWLARMQSQVESPLAKTRDATERNHRRLLTVLKSRNEARMAKEMGEHIEVWGRQQVVDLKKAAADASES